MHHPHRTPREEPSSPLVDEPGSLPVEPDEGPVGPGDAPAEEESEPTTDVPH